MIETATCVVEARYQAVLQCGGLKARQNSSQRVMLDCRKQQKSAELKTSPETLLRASCPYAFHSSIRENSGGSPVAGIPGGGLLEARDTGSSWKRRLEAWL